MDFGKKITTESYHAGKIRSTKTIYSIPSLVSNESQAFNEIMKCLAIITKDKPDTMTIRIDLDPKTKRFRMITHEYEVEK